MTNTVKMTKINGDSVATANVPAGSVAVWESAGWKVAPFPKSKAKAKE